MVRFKQTEKYNLKTPECRASVSTAESLVERLLRTVATCATLSPSTPSSSPSLSPSPCLCECSTAPQRSSRDPLLNKTHSYRPAERKRKFWGKFKMGNFCNFKVFFARLTLFDGGFQDGRVGPFRYCQLPELNGDRTSTLAPHPPLSICIAYLLL